MQVQGWVLGNMDALKVVSNKRSVHKRVERVNPSVAFSVHHTIEEIFRAWQLELLC